MRSNRFSTGMLLLLLGVLIAPGSLAAEELASADEAYTSAFQELLEGHYGEAYDRFAEIRRRYPETPHALMATVRMQRLERLDLPVLRRRSLDQSGRMETIVFGTLYSTWLGIGTARLMDSEFGGKPVAAGMMIGAPVGFLSSWALTRDRRLTDGQASLITFSGYWGTWQGYGWSILLDSNDDAKTIVGGAMAGGLLGIAAAALLAPVTDPSAGDASLIHYGGLWGTWTALCLGIIADIEEEDRLLGLVLMGGNLGAGILASLTSKIEASVARTRLVNLGGIIGTLAAAGVLLLVQPETEESAFSMLLGGGLVGLVAGIQATRSMDAPTNAKSPPTTNQRPRAGMLPSSGVHIPLWSLQF